MNQNCSNCKFGFKCAFMCICTRGIPRNKYNEFKEKSNTFRNELQTYYSTDKRNYQLKFSTYDYFKEFIMNNITEFTNKCDNYVEKHDKKGTGHGKPNHENKSHEKQEFTGSTAMSDALDAAMIKADDQQDSKVEVPDDPENTEATKE